MYPSSASRGVEAAHNQSVEIYEAIMQEHALRCWSAYYYVWRGRETMQRRNLGNPLATKYK